MEERGGGSLWDGASLFDAGPDWLTGTSKHSPDAVTLGDRARELGLEFQDQGNEWIYHGPLSTAYRATQPERCFATSAEAEAAGYRPPQR